jgi:hypothetical protein
MIKVRTLTKAEIKARDALQQRIRRPTEAEMQWAEKQARSIAKSSKNSNSSHSGPENPDNSRPAKSKPRKAKA